MSDKTNKRQSPMLPPSEKISPHGEQYLVPQPSPSCTMEEPEDISVRITDTLFYRSEDRSKEEFQVSTSCKELESDKELAMYLESHGHSSYTIRLITICQTDSWSELCVDVACLDKIIEQHDVKLNLALTTSFFGSKINSVEEAYCGSVLRRHVRDTFEISYILKYPEMKKSPLSGKETWVIRQVGVYQQYCKSTGRSVWILFCCNEESRGEEKVNEYLNDFNRVAAAHDPGIFHLILFSTYLCNWRSYMAFFEAELLNKTNKALTSTLEDISRISHETITRVRVLETHLTPLPPIFTSVKSVLQALETLLGDSQEPNPYQEQVCFYSSLIDSYHVQSEVLLKRCDTLSQIIVESIGIKSQQTAQKQNQLMLHMNQMAVQDSASIKVITIVTLVYLPASFVATFFGMQFFQLSPPRLWIFFSIATSLTVLTIIGWLWSMRVKKQRSAKVACDVEKCFL